MKSLSVFSSAFNSVRNRYSQLTITILALVAGGFLYYFYFLNLRTENLDQRQYRVLNRIENQLRINLEGYKNLAIGQTLAALNKLDAEGNVHSPEETAAALERISFIKQASVDSGNLVFYYAYLADEGIKSPREAYALVSHADVDSLFAISVVTPVQLNSDSKVEQPAVFQYIISVGSLLRPLLRHDMFDHFMILRDDQVVYETVSSGLTEFKCDTIADEKNTIDGTHSVKHVTINGMDYRVYQVGFSTDGETGWTIIGLKSADRFATERRSLPRSYLFGVFLLAIFIILSIPFIKSLIMSRTERLGTTDVLFSAISLALATSVVSLLFLDGYLRMDADDNEQESQLVALSGMVEQNLKNETDSITKQLQDYANFIASHREDIQTTGGHQWTPVKARYEPQYYAGFNNMFLVNNSGYTDFDYNDPGLRFNVKSRHYVNAIWNGQCMNFRGVASPLFLDAIISWREQQFRGVVSIPIHDADFPGFRVAAMTARLRSVSAPILPPGCGFAVFDKEGNVLFHSDSTRSLNENLLEECDNAMPLQAAITGRMNTVMDLEYSGVPVKLYVRPLGDLPYFVAAFSQLAPVEAVHGQVFGMAFILQLILFSFYVAVILLGLALMRRKSRLHIGMFDISVFTPSAAGKERYVGALLFNILHGALLLTTAFFLDRTLTIIFLFFISAPYTIYLNMVQLSDYKLRDFIKGQHSKLFQFYFSGILLANIIMLNYVSHWWVLPLVQFATLGIFLVIENRSSVKSLAGVFYRIAQRHDYRSAYYRLVFILVLLTCVVPAITFGITAYDKEKEIQVKTAQLGILESMGAQDYSGRLKDDALWRLSAYYAPFFATELSEDPGTDSSVDQSAAQFDAFSATMRSFIQNSGEKYNRLKFGSSDTLWHWTYHSKDQVALVGRNEHPCKPDLGYHLLSKVAFFHVPLFSTDEIALSFRFWISLFTAVIALYFVLRFFTSKVFVHEKYSRARSLRFDQEFFDHADPGYKAFVAGMPAAGKSAYFRTIFTKKKELFVIDFIQGTDEERDEILKEAVKAGPGVVLVDHFEHDLLNADFTKHKLHVIEALAGIKDKKIIVISSVQPGVFINMMDAETVLPEKKEEAEQMYERWNRVLAAFYDFIFPLQGYERVSNRLSAIFAERLAPGEHLAVPGKLVELIESECDHGMFLRSIGVELFAELHERKEIHVTMNEDDKWKEREDLIMRTQKLAENYYRSLWNHLAVEEQFVLFDLAQDGLVNPRNRDVVEALIDKGLVIYTNRLRIMNRSFRNFILCVVGPADLGKLERQVRDIGAWSKLRPALILVVLAMFLFVMKSDRSQLFGYFTAFMAIIPTVVTLFGFFGVSNRKE